jgi:AhpD family alkylhydroperoxidase
VTSPNISQPRVAPGDRREVGFFAHWVARISGAVQGTTPPNVFLTLGRNRRLFWGWLHFAGRMMPGGSLPRRETELVILRVAHLRDCSYEFNHHVHLSRGAGVTAADVEAVMAGPDASGWSDRERAILTAVDQMHHEGDIDDNAWQELKRHLSPPKVVELVLLVGHYEMLATAIATLRIEADEDRPNRLSRRISR